jgi:gamma-glutamylcyclotransferase (GGCT)/AIG2-like uncharacterized protein YtfP
MTAAGAGERDQAAELLFVYGTLRSDIGGAMHDLLVRYATPRGRASLSGRLYDVGWYPALVAGGSAGGRVLGELYEVRPGVAAALFAQLDEYEGCDPAAPARSLFLREEHDVELDSGERLRAWTYVYNRSVADLPVVPSGDYAVRTPAAGGEVPPSEG